MSIRETVYKNHPEIVEKADDAWDILTDSMGKLWMVVMSKREVFTAGFASGYIAGMKLDKQALKEAFSQEIQKAMHNIRQEQGK